MKDRWKNTCRQRLFGFIEWKEVCQIFDDPNLPPAPLPELYVLETKDDGRVRWRCVLQFQREYEENLSPNDLISSDDARTVGSSITDLATIVLLVYFYQQQPT